MKVIVDGRDDVIKAAEGTRLGAFIEEAKIFLSGRHRVVTTFVLDGEELTADGRPKVEGRSVDEFASLEITTVDPRVLATSILDQFSHVLSGMEGTCQKASEELISGHSDQALSLFGQAFDHWNVVVTGVKDVTRLFAIRWDQLRVDDATFDEHLKRLSTGLTNFRRAFALRDVVKIGDVMEYELKPLIPPWVRIVGVLREEITKRTV